MDTNLAPLYANLVLWNRMRTWRKRYKDAIIIEQRLIDDVFLVVQRDTDIKALMSDLRSSIDIEFTCTMSHTSTVFLDLYIEKGERFRSHGLFDHKTHEKPMHSHMYLPFSSAHRAQP